MIDDHSRYAYVECHRDQGGDTAAAVLGRAIEHFERLAWRHRGRDERQRIRLPKVQCFPGCSNCPWRSPHTDPALRTALERQGGALIQTLKREWAYAHSWPNSAERTRAMASFLRYYNRRRPYSSLGDRPPINRVHNVGG